MYKVSVPIGINTITEETLPIFLDAVKKCKAERVFICCLDDIHTEQSQIYTMPEELGYAIKFFQSNGLEVGIWINSFGHGVALSHDIPHKEENVVYTQMEGINGEVGEYANCPLDKNFTKAFLKGIKKLAMLAPDIIMLDDDFRLNTRFGYYMGCFCPLHLQEFYKRVGEEVPRDKIEELIFTGGKNKYRTAYMELMKDTILDFAKMTRKAIDEVDCKIRLGTCSTYESWDFSGTDVMEIAKTLAGNTKPFTRTVGAPYHDTNIIPAVEATRMQFEWGKGSGVELFSEGDTYPRPRYNVSSKVLELFDFALIANGMGDGILAYMFDYVQKPDYETGYIDRYINNEVLYLKKKEILSENIL